MLSWDYPRKNNLHDRIQRAGIYPITVLQTLSRAQIARLIEHDVIVTNDLVLKPNILRMLRLSEEQSNRVMAEVEAIVSHHTSA